MSAPLVDDGPFNGVQMDLRHALEYAAEAIKAQDGGDMTTETGWRSDELLAAWLAINDAIDRYDLSRKAGEMRHAIDQMELAMMGLGDFVELPSVFDGSPDELVIAPKFKVGDVRRACAALEELTRIINSEEYVIAKLDAKQPSTPEDNS